MLPDNNHGPKTCPRCHKEYTDYPAISRIDNETPICPNCGIEEARMQPHMRKYQNDQKKITDNKN